jgi:hypothetical protein
VGSAGARGHPTALAAAERAASRMALDPRRTPGRVADRRQAFAGGHYSVEVALCAQFRPRVRALRGLRRRRYELECSSGPAEIVRHRRYDGESHRPILGGLPLAGVGRSPNLMGVPDRPCHARNPPLLPGLITTHRCSPAELPELATICGVDDLRHFAAIRLTMCKRLPEFGGPATRGQGLAPARAQRLERVGRSWKEA